MNIWEKRDDESPKQYAAFWDYASMGPGRSLAALLKIYLGQIKGNSGASPPVRSLQTIEIWSSKFDWVKRVNAYDLSQIANDQQVKNELRRQVVADEWGDYEKQRMRWQELWENTSLFLRETRRTVDGATIHTVALNILDFQRLTSLRDDITRQGRRALNMPDRYIEQKISIDVTLVTSIIDMAEKVGVNPEDLFSEVFTQLVEASKQRADQPKLGSGESGN